MSHSRKAVVPVLLAGGSGTRLWPLSRELSPKQFLSLRGGETMLQETLLRASRIPGASRAIVVCVEPHRFTVAEQIRATGVEADIIVQPEDRETAPAVAAAALQAGSRECDPLLLILPVDHLISETGSFNTAVRAGILAAGSGYLVTFGIVPHRPETGYGYIKKGRLLAEDGGAAANSSHSRHQPQLSGSEDSGNGGEKLCCSIEGAARSVARFVEKPEAATARRYIREGYLWNSGIFLFQASAVLEQLAQFEPEMRRRVEASFQARSQDMDFIRLEPAAFSLSPSRSLDHAVMERTRKAAVIPLACGWADIGSWNALWETGEPDRQGNIIKGRVLLRESRNCYVQGSNRLLALLGVDDLVVVETADAVLVARRDRTQEVKELVNQLREQGHNEGILPPPKS